jgi:hypothetical protein
LRYINLKRGFMISLNQEIKKNNIDIFPAYSIEKNLGKFVRTF